MPPSVSIPEKTLEHWSSLYITYRYRSKAALWWPSSGEDIDVRWLPTRPGKAVQLELKTTTVAGAGLHDVLVDLGQLWEYRQRPLGHQPFYVFPRPDWNGDLAAAANAYRRPVTELAFRRSGPGWWFADWMVVLTAAQVADVLQTELLAHGSRTRGRTKQLVRFDLNHSPTRITWDSGATPPNLVRWRHFWSALDQCGEVGWPQLIRLPARIAQTYDPYTRSRVVGLLRQTADMPVDDGGDVEFVTLMPDAGGNYQIARDLASDLSEPHRDGTNEVDDHRQVIFLDARALRRAT